MDETTIDWEAVTEGAWRGFREALADALEMLEPGACLQVALDAGDVLDGASRTFKPFGLATRSS